MIVSEQVYKRLYDERTKREEAMKYKIQEENERHPFMPSGAEEYNEECWHRYELCLGGLKTMYGTLLLVMGTRQHRKTGWRTLI